MNTAYLLRYLVSTYLLKIKLHRSVVFFFFYSMNTTGQKKVNNIPHSLWIRAKNLFRNKDYCLLIIFHRESSTLQDHKVKNLLPVQGAAVSTFHRVLLTWRGHCFCNLLIELASYNLNMNQVMEISGRIVGLHAKKEAPQYAIFARPCEFLLSSQRLAIFKNHRF